MDNISVILLVLSVLVIAISFFRFELAISFFIYFKFFVPKALNLYNFPGLPVISFDRLILFALVLVFIFRIISNRDERMRLKDFPFHLAMILLTISALVSTVFSQASLSVSLNRLLSFIVEGYIMTLMVWSAFSTKDHILKIYKWIIFLLSLTALYGIYNFITGENTFISWLTEKMEDSDKVLLYTYDSVSERFGMAGRVQSIFMHPMVFGLYLSLFFVFILLFFIYVRRGKAFFVALLLLFLVNVFFTNSRTPLVSLIIGVLFVLFYLKKIKPVIIISAIVVAGILIFGGPDSFMLKLLKSTFLFWLPDQDSGGSSIDMRYMQLVYVLFLFIQNPVTGLGLGAMRDLINSGSDLLGGESIIFWVLVEQGVIGFITFVFFYVNIYYKAWRNYRASTDPYDVIISLFTYILIPCYLIFIVLTGTLETISVFYILLAMGFKYSYLGQQERKSASGEEVVNEP